MVRLRSQPRAVAAGREDRLAQHQIKKAIIWGNHSATQYPDLHQAAVDGKPALSLVDQKWYAETFIPVVQQRGAASSRLVASRRRRRRLSRGHRPHP